ncbi:MAG: PilN domain-containing protein [Phycisphaerales bacterium]|nr:MAG: PilN domain-containing protein [Phycisphaerales bacterium]
MVDVNFVPEDYAQNNESRRTNFIYLVLFAVLMTALGGSFAAVKIRQRACIANEELVNKRLAEMQEAIKQFEELQAKRREMMKTALTTAELIEPVPRSILLASLTNNLPTGVSLSDLKLVQKQIKQNASVATTSKYQATQAQKRSQQEDQQNAASVNPEKLVETHINIGGVAPSDLQVAAYIKRLTGSSLLDNVALVESKEYKVEATTLRQFKLTAMLRKDVHLTKEDVEGIRSKAVNSIWNF